MQIQWSGNWINYTHAEIVEKTFWYGSLKQLFPFCHSSSTVKDPCIFQSESAFQPSLHVKFTQNGILNVATKWFEFDAKLNMYIGCMAGFVFNCDPLTQHERIGKYFIQLDLVPVWCLNPLHHSCVWSKQNLFSTFALYSVKILGWKHFIKRSLWETFYFGGFFSYLPSNVGLS